MTEIIKTLNALVWGAPMLGLLAVTGLYLTLGLKGYPLFNLKRAFSFLWAGRQAKGEGDISGFNALMTSLSATIGTGNIAGVATAIALGGPGALFWMWLIAVWVWQLNMPKGYLLFIIVKKTSKVIMLVALCTTSKMAWAISLNG